MDQTFLNSVRLSLQETSKCDTLTGVGYYPGVLVFYEPGILNQSGFIKNCRLPFMDNQISIDRVPTIHPNFYYASPMAPFHLYATLLGIKYAEGSVVDGDCMESTTRLNLVLSRRSRGIDADLYMYARAVSGLPLPFLEFDAQQFRATRDTPDLVEMGLFSVDESNTSNVSSSDEGDDDYTVSRGLVIYCPPSYGKTAAQKRYPYRWVDTDSIFNCDKRVVRTMLNLGFTIFTNMWNLIDPQMNVLILVPPGVNMVNRFVSERGISPSEAKKWAKDILEWADAFQKVRNDDLHAQYVRYGKVASLYRPKRQTFLSGILKHILVKGTPGEQFEDHTSDEE